MEPHSVESKIRELYLQWLKAWNHRSADDMAELVAEDGSLVGFDGSQINGRAEIEEEMRRIFVDHQTARYIAIIREIRKLTDEVWLLRAVVGMVPPGQSKLNAAVNAIQSMVAVEKNGGWQIALFQNTPAQFHGRPHLAERLTEELNHEIEKGL